MLVFAMQQILETNPLALSIANTVKDYRVGDLTAPTALHVCRWVSQFDSALQLQILHEMDRLLKVTYITKDDTIGFLRGLLTNTELSGNAPRQFWQAANFLDIQLGGNSQSEMITMFSELMKEDMGLQIVRNKTTKGPFIYLDEISFTGNRVRNDLNEWVKNDAPSSSVVHVIVVASHSGGEWYAKRSVQETAAKCQKVVSLKWWRATDLEERKKYSNTSDVFRPSSLPSDARTLEYVRMLEATGYPPALRDAGKMGKCHVFDTEAGRHLLEQAFWTAGLEIRRKCTNLKETHRPLGYSSLATLGFGSTVLTFRNCPNNCPLALWAGDPWYPLFARKNNERRQTADAFGF